MGRTARKPSAALGRAFAAHGVVCDGMMRVQHVRQSVRQQHGPGSRGTGCCVRPRAKPVRRRRFQRADGCTSPPGVVMESPTTPKHRSWLWEPATAHASSASLLCPTLVEANDAPFTDDSPEARTSRLTPKASLSRPTCVAALGLCDSAFRSLSPLCRTQPDVSSLHQRTAAGPVCSEVQRGLETQFRL